MAQPRHTPNEKTHNGHRWLIAACLAIIIVCILFIFTRKPAVHLSDIKPAATEQNETRRPTESETESGDRNVRTKPAAAPSKTRSSGSRQNPNPATAGSSTSAEPQPTAAQSIDVKSIYNRLNPPTGQPGRAIEPPFGPSARPAKAPAKQKPRRMPQQ